MQENCKIKLKKYIVDRRLLVISMVIGILMGLMILLGIRYSTNELIYHTFGEFLIRLSGWSLCMFLMIWCLYVGFDLLSSTKLEFCEKTDSQSNCSRRIWLIKWLKWMLISWCIYLPVFLAVYPGIYSYDASEQILQFFGYHPLTTHHPLIHTAYLGLCMKFGGYFFHTYQAGMALYSLSQSLFMSSVFAFCLCRMEIRRVPKWFRLVSWAFWILNPYLTVFSFVTTKDVIFGAFFMLVFDGACQLVGEPEYFWKKMAVFFFADILLMTLFRNQGIYVFLFFSLFVCITLKKEEYHRGWFVKASLLVVLLWYILSSLLPTMIGIGKGDARELLCVPMQQIARAYDEMPEKLTAEEKEYIETLIDETALNEYVRVNADPVKSGFHTEVMKADIGKFIRIWAEIGMKMPDVYLDSFLMGNWGYWYPGDSQYWIYYIIYDGAFLDGEFNILNIRRNSHFYALSEWLGNVTRTPAFEQIPVLAIILNQAFPFWLMLFAAGMAIWRGKLKDLLPMTLVLGYWGTLLLGPVTSLRYALPLIYCVPLLVVCLMTGKEKTSHDSFGV